MDQGVSLCQHDFDRILFDHQRFATACHRPPRMRRNDYAITMVRVLPQIEACSSFSGLVDFSFVLSCRSRCFPSPARGSACSVHTFHTLSLCPLCFVLWTTGRSGKTVITIIDIFFSYCGVNISAANPIIHSFTTTAATRTIPDLTFFARSRQPSLLRLPVSNTSTTCCWMC